MSYYQLMTSDPMLFIFIIAISLVVTLVAYGAGPFIFYMTQKSIVSQKRFRLFCIIYTILVFILLRLVWTDNSSYAPAFLWGTVYYGVFSKKVYRKNDMIERTLKSGPSEKWQAETIEPEEVVSKTDTVDLEKGKVKVRIHRAPNNHPVEVGVKTSRNMEPAETLHRERKPVSTILIVLCGVLACSTAVSLFFAVRAAKHKGDIAAQYEVLQTDYNNLMERSKEKDTSITTLNVEISDLKFTIDQLQQDVKIAENKADEYLSAAWECVDGDFFLRTRIGFIVSGNGYYHSFSCPVFQNADEYWAHNIEYCEYLGYSYCPACWESDPIE